MKSWSNYTRSEWELPDYFNDARAWVLPKNDAIVVILIAAALTVLRGHLQSYFYERAKKLEIKEAFKWSESMWKTIFYIFSFWAEFTLVKNSNTFPETIHCWEGFPHMSVSTELNLFYLFQMGFYVHSLITHFAFEVRRSDFYVLMFHHLVTLWLIYFSYIMKFYRIGVLVLLVHDVNDIFLEIGKATNYMDLESISTTFFVGLIVSWFLSRLVIFPFKIIYSTAIETLSFIPYDLLYPFYWVFNIALAILLVLHVYWFWLMLKMAYRKLSGNNLEDIREEETTTSSKKNL